MLISLKEYIQERLDLSKYYEDLEFEQVKQQPNIRQAQLYENLIRLYLATHIMAMNKR
jgi:hypothetical protein